MASIVAPLVSHASITIRVGKKSPEIRRSPGFEGWTAKGGL